MDKKWLDVNSLCRIYSIGRTTLYELLKDPDAPEPRYLGRKRLINADKFESFFERKLSHEKETA